MARSVIGELVWRVVGDTSQIDRALPGTERKVSGVSKAIGLAEKSALGMAAALAVVAKQAFDAGKAFDQGLGNVATLLNDPTASIEGLKDDVKDLAIDTGQSLENLTGGLYQVVSAFGDTAEATLQLEQAAKAAKAGVATVTDAVSLASSVTKAYGDTSAEAQQKVFDLAFQTVKLGETTFPELASAMQNVTDRSQALGVSQEELFATMATLTGVTGDANKVSTQLKSALVALDSPTETLTALYKKLGVESGQALIEQEGLQGAFRLIQEDSEASGVSMNDYLGRVEAVTAASAIATSQSETYAAKLIEVTNSSGAASAAFDVQTSTLNGTAFEYDRLVQSVEVLKTTLYDFYSEELANTFSGLVTIIEAFGDLNDKVQESQETLGVFSDVLGLANPVKAVREYNSLIFGALGNLGSAKEETEEIAEYTDSWLSKTAGLEEAQARVTEELDRQSEAAQEQADEVQRILDLESQRINKVVEDRSIIEDAYANEVRAIEAKNELGLLSEQEYIAKRLEAEQKLVDDLIQLGYDGQTLDGERREIGDQLIQESLARQLEYTSETAASETEIWNKALLDFETRHGQTFEQAQADQARLEAQTKKNEEAFKSLTSSGIGALSSGFAQIGEDLVNQELSWKSFASLALEAVAAVLDGIGARLAGDAALLIAEALLFGNPALAAGAGPALLGSFAAYGAAGALRAASGSFEAGGIVPGPPSISDNRIAMVRSGEEIIPEEDPRHSNNGGNSELTVNMIWDADIVAKTIVEDYINTGRYTITARGLR